MIFAWVALFLVMLSGGCAATLVTANLPIQVAAANGALQESILPPGAWVNDLDEHFVGSALPNGWHATVNGEVAAGGEGNCQAPGAMVFNNPGITIYGLPYDVPNDLSNGCVVEGWPWQQGPSSPGYYEAKMLLDTGPHTWTAMFFEFGPNAGDGCPGATIAQGGIEVDVNETILSTFNLHWNGYGACAQSTSFGNWGTRDGLFHVWGIDFGDNGSITFYRDGNQLYPYTPAGGVEPGICPIGSVRCVNGNWQGQFIFMNLLCFQHFCSDTTTNGTTIAWARHYRH